MAGCVVEATALARVVLVAVCAGAWVFVRLDALVAVFGLLDIVVNVKLGCEPERVRDQPRDRRVSTSRELTT